MAATKKLIEFAKEKGLESIARVLESAYVDDCNSSVATQEELDEMKQRMHLIFLQLVVLFLGEMAFKKHRSDMLPSQKSCIISATGHICYALHCAGCRYGNTTSEAEHVKHVSHKMIQTEHIMI